MVAETHAKNPDNVACCLSTIAGFSLLMLDSPDTWTYRRAINNSTNTVIKIIIAPATHPKMMPTIMEFNMLWLYCITSLPTVSAVLSSSSMTTKF